MNTLPDEPKTVSRQRAEYIFLNLRKDRPQPGLPIVFFDGLSEQWYTGVYDEKYGFFCEGVGSFYGKNILWFYAGGLVGRKNFSEVQK